MSKSELSQITLDTSNSKVMDMLAPYGNVDASAYRFDIHTTRYERGAFIAPRTFSSGSLPVTSTFTPCSSAEVGISGLMNNGYADVISARLCINPERIQPSIFGGVIGNVFSKDGDICQNVCTLDRTHSKPMMISKLQVMI